MPGSARVLEGARVVFQGWNDDDPSRGCELPVFELLDERADEFLREEIEAEKDEDPTLLEELPDLVPYATSDARRASGLKVYWFLFSY